MESLRDCWKIEITEEHTERAEIDLKELIGKLRQAGFTVALDDFGTRSRSESVPVISVEFDVLKLDKTMVDDMVNNPKAQAIIESIAGICKNGNSGGGRGIETEEQMSVLVPAGGQQIPAGPYLWRSMRRSICK